MAKGFGMQNSLGAFGDRRVDRAGAFLKERLIEVGQSGVRVRPLGGDRAGEVRLGRFLRRERVTPGKMIEAAGRHTSERVAGRHVLVIQDTSTLRDDGDKRSRNLHPSIAVDAADWTLLGLVHASFHTRSGGQKELRGKRPFEDKESQRWLEATQHAAKLVAAGAACVTVVADRECDIHDEFALRPAETELVIRARHDRVLANKVRLFSCTDGLPELGREIISLPSAPGRPGPPRAARLARRRWRCGRAR
jgi:hypothetical protein